jgi:sugar phosphate isomerase/epimerase
MYLFALLFLLPLFSEAQVIGLQLSSFNKQFEKDIPGTIKKIHDLGITAIEGGDMNGISPAAFKQLLDENNIQTVSVGSNYEELENNPQAVVERAKLYGAKYVVCYWIPHNDTTGFTLKEAEQAAVVFNKAGKLFAENGLTCCYHAHGFEFVPWQQSNLYDYLMQHFDSRYVNFEIDVFWMKMSGHDPVELMKQYKGRFKLLHLKDRRIGTENTSNGHGDPEADVVLGEGDVNLAAVMKEAKAQHIKYAFIEDESSRSETQVPQSLSYLEKLSKGK